jgi:Na+-translocating ferredoxin:NAD+ oxidoreductase RnfD subunit
MTLLQAILVRSILEANCANVVAAVVVVVGAAVVIVVVVSVSGGSGGNSLDPVTHDKVVVMSRRRGVLRYKFRVQMSILQFSIKFYKKM